MITALEIFVEVVQLTKQRILDNTINAEEYEKKVLVQMTFAEAFCSSNKDAKVLGAAIEILGNLIANETNRIKG